MSSLSYLSFYGDAANDAYAGEYARAMELFNARGNAPVSAMELEGVINDGASDGATPMAFLVLSGKDEEARVQCYHRVRKFPARYGGASTPWNGRAFAFKGEVLGGGHPPTVE